MVYVVKLSVPARQKSHNFEVTFYGDLAEELSQRARIGQRIKMVGELSSRQFTDKLGNANQRTEIIGRRIDWLDEKGKKDGEFISRTI